MNKLQPEIEASKLEVDSALMINIFDDKYIKRSTYLKYLNDIFKFLSVISGQYRLLGRSIHIFKFFPSTFILGCLLFQNVLFRAH